MVGADEETFARIQEPFSRCASLVVHAGETGDGIKMKLARNMLTFIGFTAVGEAQRLAEAAGLSLNDLGKVVRHSDALTGGAGAIMFRDDTKPLAPDHFLYKPFLHNRGLGEKDLSLALALGESLSVDLPFAQLALEQFAANLGVPHTDAETAKDA
jgi:3-hydroxyisobutyrate dehydrogenase-like beta-hydroxyacid dehydrogenase